MGLIARSPSCRMDVWFRAHRSTNQLRNPRTRKTGPNIGHPNGAGIQRKRGIVMRKWCQAVVQFIEREDGPTAVEYAVMLALIIVVCLAAITTLGQNANGTFNNVALNTAAK